MAIMPMLQRAMCALEALGLDAQQLVAMPADKPKQR
jgi:hypothetical protein